MKINLKDITFTIPLRVDSTDRLHNINYVVNYLNSNFITNIFIYESGPEPRFNVDPTSGVKYIYEENSSFFYRTRYLNIMARMATTPFIANYDCDVVFPVKQVQKAYMLLQNNDIDAVYPYDGYFVNIPQVITLTKVKNYNVDSLNPDEYQNFGKSSMGGAVFWNKKAFIEGGMENENFLSWGCEDWERYKRFTKLGYRIGRIKGPLYHINHSRSQDSNESNPHYQKNIQEFQKVDNMPTDQLKDYVKTWPWLY